jgi:predicted secreted protein
MANHAGNEGSVYVGAVQIGELTGWSIDQSGETLEDTTLGDQWRTRKALGLKSWSGSCDGFFDEADLGQVELAVGTEVSLNFYFGGNTTGQNYFSGSAIITSMSTSGSMDAMQDVSFSFEGNGALTQSAVA